MASLKDFEPLNPAEEKLLAVASAGKQCAFGRVRPELPDEANLIRADFLRFLALGGGSGVAVHESGLRIQGAYIDGAINLNGATKVRPLWIQDCTITGEFSFSDAETKVVSLDRSIVSSVRGDGVSVDGSLLLRHTVIDGSLQLFGAQIMGTLSCAGCVIGGKRWRSQRLAAELSTVTVGGNLEFRDGFQANGLILLDDAEVGGTFDCTEAKLSAGFDETSSNPPGRWDTAAQRALKGHRLDVNGSLYLRDCACDGELSFSGAQIGGDIDCRNGQFRSAGHSDTSALRFTRIQAGGNIYLSSGFEAKGKVQLNGATVRGNIECRGGIFSVPPSISRDFAAPGDAFTEDAISLVNAVVNGALIMAPIDGREEPAAAIDGSIDLKSAYIRVLVDDPDAWPKQKQSNGLKNVIHLDGFTYDRFAGNAPVEAYIRKHWLKRQPPAHLGHDFKPQPFEQVIKVLRNMGHPEEARRLAIARQGYLTRRRLAKWRTGVHGALRAFGALLWAATAGLLIGYGYRPARVLFIMAALGVACGFYYKLAAEQGAFAPRDAQVFLFDGFKKCEAANGGNWTKCREPGFLEYPQFNPWVYSFNVILPVVDLEQEKSWVPMQREVAVTAGGVSFMVPEWGTNALVLAELVFGWVASLLAVAAFSGLVKTE